MEQHLVFVRPFSGIICGDVITDFAQIACIPTSDCAQYVARLAAQTAGGVG